jgi:hypothetical protein
LKIHVHSLGEAHPKTGAIRTLYAQLVQEQQEETVAKSCHEARQADKASLSLHKGADAPALADDSLQEFLEACCERHPHAWCRSAELWQSYEQWVAKCQERYPLSRGAFIAQLKEHGYRPDRTRTARIWRGIALMRKAP